MKYLPLIIMLAGCQATPKDCLKDACTPDEETAWIIDQLSR